MPTTRETILQALHADAKPNPDMRFRFDVRIFEPQILKAQSMHDKLHELTAVVESVVATLTPRLFPWTVIRACPKVASRRWWEFRSRPPGS